MFTALGILIIIVAILLALIVLIQNPKGGMLSSTFGSMGNQILGANRSTDVVEKITWYLAGGIMLLCIGSAFLSPEVDKSPLSNQKSEIEEALKNSKSTSLPSAPASMPTAQPQTQAPAQQNAQPAAPEVKK